MHELRIERSVNTHGREVFLSLKDATYDPGVNSTLRAARAFNDPYEPDELKLYSTDRKGA